MPTPTTTWAWPSATWGRTDEAIAAYRRAHGSATGLRRGTQQLGEMPCSNDWSRRGRRQLPPGRGAEARLCRSALQSGHRPQGPGQAGRSGRLLPPGPRIAAAPRRSIAAWSVRSTSAPMATPARSLKSTGAGRRPACEPLARLMRSARQRPAPPDAACGWATCPPISAGTRWGAVPPAAFGSPRSGGLRDFCYASTRRARQDHGPLPGPRRRLARCPHLSDEQLAAAVRDDGVDILVDLSSTWRTTACWPSPASRPRCRSPTWPTPAHGTAGDRLSLHRSLLDPARAEPAEFYAESRSGCRRRIGATCSVHHVPPARGSARRSARACHLRLLEQFLQGDAADAGGLERPLAGCARVAAALHAHAGGHRQGVLDFLPRQGVSPHA